MNEETERTKFRYMLEFPNRIKVYCVDEQLFSNLLERYCAAISAVSSDDSLAPTKQEENPRIVSAPTASLCPECGSNRVRVVDERGGSICLDCACVLPTQKQANSPQDADAKEDAERARAKTGGYQQKLLPSEPASAL